MSQPPISHQSNATIDDSARERIHARTRELAVLAGRHPQEITYRDYEQAKRELTAPSPPTR